MVILRKHEKTCYLNLAKVGVEGSNPFARSKITLSHNRYRLELLALFADVRRRKRPWFLGAD